MNRFLIGLASLTATLASAPLLARAADLFPRQSVSVSGLDLTTSAGQAIIHRRIKQAASNVCGTPDTRRLEEQLRASNCRKLAIAGAEDQLAVRVARAGASRPGSIVVASLRR